MTTQQGTTPIPIQDQSGRNAMLNGSGDFSQQDAKIAKEGLWSRRKAEKGNVDQGTWFPHASVSLSCTMETQ